MFRFGSFRIEESVSIRKAVHMTMVLGLHEDARHFVQQIPITDDAIDVAMEQSATYAQSESAPNCCIITDADGRSNQAAFGNDEMAQV